MDGGSCSDGRADAQLWRGWGPVNYENCGRSFSRAAAFPGRHRNYGYDDDDNNDEIVNSARTPNSRP